MQKTGQMTFFKPEEENSKSMTFLIDGDGNSGKTALILRYIDSIFTSSKFNFPSPIQSKSIQINDKTMVLNLIDTPPIDPYENRGKAPKCNAIILAFDLTDKEGLTNLSSWVAEKMRYYDSDVKIILAGTKKDGGMAINEEAIKAFAENYGLTYVLTSAKNNENIDELFIQTINLASKRVNIPAMSIVIPEKTKESCHCCII